MVGRGQGFAQGFLGEFVVAGVAEPDAVEVFGVLDVAHGIEGDVDLAVYVVFTLLHLGEEHADDGEGLSVEADVFAQRPAAGEEPGLGLGADDADMGALIVLSAVEEAPLIDVELEDVLIDGADSVDGPGEGVQVVLHGDVLVDHGRDVDESGHAGCHAVHIVQGEAHADTGFVAACLLAGAAGKGADDGGPPLGEDGLEGAAEAGAVGQ